MPSEIKISVKSDFDGLNKILKEAKAYHIKIGVLGNPKSADGVSVATYGQAHEFGLPERNLPKRSFLKEPLEKHLGDGIKDVEGTLNKLIIEKQYITALEVIGMKGVEIVKKAFETRNDGKWQDLAESTKQKMKPERLAGYTILVDEGTLVGSITSRVDKND